MNSILFIPIANLTLIAVLSSKNIDDQFKTAVWFIWTIFILGYLVIANNDLFGKLDSSSDLPTWLILSAMIAPFLLGPLIGKLLDEIIGKRE